MGNGVKFVFVRVFLFIFVRFCFWLGRRVELRWDAVIFVVFSNKLFGDEVRFYRFIFGVFLGFGCYF